MTFILQRPTYKGVVNLVQTPHELAHGQSDNVCEFSTIRIGVYDLNDVTCSPFLANHLNVGEEVELALSGINLISMVLVILGSVLKIVGYKLDYWAPDVAGTALLLIGLYYFIKSFSYKGHKVYSVTVNGKKYMD